EETRGEADGDAVLLPELLAMAGAESNESGRAHDRSVETLDEHGRGFVLAHELTAIDVAVARAMLRRDFPLPTRPLRRRARERPRRAIVLARDRERAITGQPMSPIHPRHVERAHEQRPESGAVEEEFAVDRSSVAQTHAGQLAGLRRAQHFAHLPFDAFDAALLGIAAQIARIQRGVEVIGVA